ncbi:MAG: hypothetical protein ACRDFA_13445 [bacterium]
MWTERMLAALGDGVKGGKWFSLMDKVYARPTPRRGHKSELPAELLADVRARKPMSSPLSARTDTAAGRLRLGQGCARGNISRQSP